MRWFGAGITLVGSHPCIESLLWGPDLVSWCFRQTVTRSSREWFDRISKLTSIIDVSGAHYLNEKRPETAAALNSGPASPAAPLEVKVSRSSLEIVSHQELKKQEIFSNLESLLAPKIDPTELRAWLIGAFPN